MIKGMVGEENRHSEAPEEGVWGMRITVKRKIGLLNRYRKLSRIGSLGQI